MKAARQRKIIELIEKYDIETQDELAKRLNDIGFNVTQATVSRDIKELSLTKVASGSGKQKYAFNQNMDIFDTNKYVRILKEGITYMECAGNLLVIKTISGMAMAVGAAVDALSFDEMIGTIAGDDTVMCAVRNLSAATDIMGKLESIIEKL